jgi:hypothetical protein
MTNIFDIAIETLKNKISKHTCNGLGSAYVTGNVNSPKKKIVFTKYFENYFANV